jgi:tRNA (cmo5U34)-methyltransferase
MPFEVPDSWTFETASVADQFDRHVREQLPWYDLITAGVAHVARHYIPQDGHVYDIGASTGNIGRALASTLDARSGRLTAIEPSSEMIKRYQAPGTLVQAKAEGIELFEEFDVAIVFLTMMFIPPSKRRMFIGRLRRACRVGGAIIIVDKLEPQPGYLGTVLYRLTLSGKREAGVDADEILDKELSLSGVQRPITEPELAGVLGEEAMQWFRFGDFAGWIIERRIPNEPQ